jgi:hypothetical protein
MSKKLSLEEKNRRAQEEANKQGVEYLGFEDPNKCFTRDYILYKCPIHGIKRTRYNTFVNVHSGCIDCSNKISLKELNKWGKKEAEQQGVEYLGFEDPNKWSTRDYILYKCPIHGIKRVQYNSFVNRHSGCQQCNCGDKIPLEELNKRANDEAIRQGVKYLGFEDSNKWSTRDYILYKCPKHGIKRIQFNSFVDGHGCKECSYGKEHKSYSVYGYLQLVNGIFNAYSGYTCNEIERNKQHQNNRFGIYSSLKQFKEYNDLENEIFEHDFIIDNLTYEEALDLEGKMLDEYIEKGYYIINKVSPRNCKLWEERIPSEYIEFYKDKGKYFSLKEDEEHFDWDAYERGEITLY